MKFYLVDGEVKFLTHKLTWQEREENRELEFYDAEKKNAFLEILSKGNIIPTIIEYEPPTQEIINKVAGKKFETCAEALEFISGNIQKSDFEILKETVDTLVLNALGV